MYIDSHAHITSDAIWPKVDKVLQMANENGIEAIINVCTNDVTLERGLKLSQKYPWVYNAAATTPHDVEKEGDALFSLMARHAREGKIVAVGETGLDYHYKHSPIDLQQEFFRKYLQLATDCRLPVIIHCREAFQDFFSIIDEEYKDQVGVLHCFTGTMDDAFQLVKRGWYLSLSGIVTYPKNNNLREVAKWVPLENLLIETDAPYLAPQTMRGKLNEPAYLPEIARCIAQEKGVDLDTLLKHTNKNTKKLFDL